MLKNQYAYDMLDQEWYIIFYFGDTENVVLALLY